MPDVPSMPDKVVCPPGFLDGCLARLVERDGLVAIEVWGGEKGWGPDPTGSLVIRDVLVAPPAGPETLKRFGVC